MKIVLLLIAALLLPGFAANSSLLKETKPTGAEEVFLDFLFGSTCSGVIVGPNQIATAEHCITAGGVLIAVDCQPVVVKGAHVTGYDQVVFDVDVTFPSHAEWSKTLPAVGERVYFWGSPEGIGKLYREGYVAGIIQGMIVLDIEVGHGDSGAGVYDSKGRIIGTVSQFAPHNEHITHTRFAVVVPFGATVE